MSNLGEYITDHRKSKNLSIRKLAELAHISHTEIYRIETGERKSPSLLVLQSISNALEEDVNEIIKAAGYNNDSDSTQKVSKIILDISDLNDSELEEVKDFIEFLRNKRNRLLNKIKT